MAPVRQAKCVPARMGVESLDAPSATPGGPRVGGRLGELLVQHLYSACLALFGGPHPRMGGVQAPWRIGYAAWLAEG